MNKPSRAGGGKPSKARSQRSLRLKRNNESKATAPRSAATQLGEWLEILGMSEYTECFAENDVDLSVLPHLTDHDLKELGVSLGHRRKMLAAIAGRADTVETPLRPSTETKPPDTTAERRQVTVMFCDLVGSTALSARMDPEDLREVIAVYQRCVAQTVQRFGGFVAKYMGDGVLAPRPTRMTPRGL
jgi:SAM domain (Sterile alpha motif)/Adenylate and Guanylate cyclase catalytic domain